AIGHGVFVVELQQPTDFSITLEWDGFLASAEAGLLGMDTDTALNTLNHGGFDESRLSTLIRHTGADDAARVPLLASEADGFFRADRLQPAGTLELAPSFGVFLVLDGAGTLHSDNAEAIDLTRGSTVVVPHGAGSLQLRGDLTAVHCRPPQLSG